MTTVADGLFQYGGMPVGCSLYNGKWFFVDPANGSDGNNGRSPERAFATLYRAHLKMTAGKNDVCVLIGDGATTGTARLSLALATSADPTAAAPTVGTLVWSKNACHLIGVTAPTRVAQRARIAPPSGTYTTTTFGSGTLISVTASGCHFENFSIYGGFSTGSTTSKTLSITGGRNYFKNVTVGGLADADSAQAAGARTLFISGSTGENTFEECTIGLDTVTRTAANASIEFAAASPRYVFKNCILPFQTSSATVLGILATGNGSMDRFQLFDGCNFINNIGSTSTAMTQLASCTTASPGGLLVFKDCNLVGIGEFGDANGLTNTRVMGASGTAATTGIAITPS